MLRIVHKRTAYCDCVLPRADLVSVGEGGEGALVHSRLDWPGAIQRQTMLCRQTNQVATGPGR